MFVLALIWPLSTLAQSNFLLFDIPYQVYDIPEYTDGWWSYSELRDYPEMYGFVLTSTTTVQLRIDAIDHADESPSISGILVQDRGQEGVSEIGRFLADDAAWDVFIDRRTRMMYRNGPEITRELGPGNYRVEVSSPSNEGRYVLKLGSSETPNSGYFESLREIRATQDFHGFGWSYMLRTSHVYVPILLFFMLIGIAGTYWYARRQRWM